MAIATKVDPNANTSSPDQWGRLPGDPQYGQPAGGAPPAGGQGGTNPYAVSPNIGDANTTRHFEDQTNMPSSADGTPTAPAAPIGKLGAAVSPYTGAQNDKAATAAWFTQQAQALGLSGIDANYYADRAMEKGGVGDGTFWRNLMQSNAQGGGSQSPVSSAIGSALEARQASSAAGTPSVAGTLAPQGLGTPTASSQLQAQPIGTAPGVGGLESTLQNLLMKRATQSLDINKNDPIIRNQEETYNARQQQGARNYLASVAEKQGPYANVSAETRAANEQVGQNTSGFEAQLMQNELTARRNEIQQALTGMQGYITDEQKMALEAQLAAMDNALQYSRLGESGRQFDANLGQSAYQFDTTRQDNILGA